MSANTVTFDRSPIPSQRDALSAATSLAKTGRGSAGSLSVLLLAALVAGLVLLADRFVSTWADEHLFLGWVLLWVVIFAGLALFAGTARSLAAQAVRALDGWSRAQARARAESRLWDIARSDPRVMADLIAIRTLAEEESEFGLALASIDSEPLTPSPEARGWASRVEPVGQSRERSMHLHYV